LYLRALRTTPDLTIHYGHYLSHNVRMALTTPVPGQPRTVEVIKTEEKGSDVNIATFLLLDAFDADCELAVVISNDSDLLLPIQTARRRFGLKVGVLNPQKKPSVVLQREADFFRPIRQGHLSKSIRGDSYRHARGVHQANRMVSGAGRGEWLSQRLDKPRLALDRSSARGWLDQGMDGAPRRGALDRCDRLPRNGIYIRDSSGWDNRYLSWSRLYGEVASAARWWESRRERCKFMFPNQLAWPWEILASPGCRTKSRRSSAGGRALG